MPLPELEQLLSQHLPSLRAFVRLRAGPVIRAKESASDLVQSVCRELIEGLDRFEFQAEGAFREWLYTTALRKIVDRQRYYLAQRRAVARELSLDDSATHLRDTELVRTYQQAFSPSAQLIAREALESIERAFDRLPAEHQEVLILNRFLGLSYAEIAARWGRGETAVRKVASRAAAKLLLQLGKQPPAPRAEHA
ncbi:MAG: RNA polymerase sigma factor [Planctomycetota bacterium]